MSVSGAPTSPKPPTMTVSPDRIADTASFGSMGPPAIAITQVPFVVDKAEPNRACMQTQGAAARRGACWTRSRRVLYTCADVLVTRSPNRWEYPRSRNLQSFASSGGIDRTGDRQAWTLAGMTE